MHELVVEWQSLTGTRTDEQDNGLTVEENHGCSLLPETELQTELDEHVYGFKELRCWWFNNLN